MAGPALACSVRDTNSIHTAVRVYTHICVCVCVSTTHVVAAQGPLPVTLGLGAQLWHHSPQAGHAWGSLPGAPMTGGAAAAQVVMCTWPARLLLCCCCAVNDKHDSTHHLLSTPHNNPHLPALWHAMLLGMHAARLTRCWVCR
jgi:hypothetical protein